MDSVLIFSISCTILIISITILIIGNLGNFMKCMHNVKSSSDIPLKEDLIIDSGKSLFYPENSINHSQNRKGQTVIPALDKMRNVSSEDNDATLHIQYTSVDKETNELLKDMQNIITYMHMYGCKNITQNIDNIISMIPETANCKDILSDDEFQKLIQMPELPGPMRDQLVLLFERLRKMSCDGDKFNRNKFISHMKNVLNALCNVKNFK